MLWVTQDKANNRSGLQVRPGGWRNSDGTFLLTGYNAFFWTSGSSEEYGICRKLTFQNSTVQRLKRNPSDGYSVRCVKDIGF
ncbi:MAG: FISUMP domain-containing protein [Bacteroidota bacterium]